MVFKEFAGKPDCNAKPPPVKAARLGSKRSISFCNMINSRAVSGATVWLLIFVPMPPPKEVDKPSALVTPVGGGANAGVPTVFGAVGVATFAAKFALRLAPAELARFWAKLAGPPGAACSGVVVSCKPCPAPRPRLALNAANNGSA